MRKRQARGDGFSRENNEGGGGGFIGDKSMARLIFVFFETEQKDIQGFIRMASAIGVTPDAVINNLDSFIGYTGDVFLLLGQPGVVWCAEKKIVKKNRTISSLSDTPYQYEDKTYFITYDPGLIAVEVKYKNIILSSAILADRYKRLGTLLTDHATNYRYVDSYDELCKHVLSKFNTDKKRVAISVDLETMGFSPRNKDKLIVSISISHSPGHAAIIRFGTPPNAPTLVDYDPKTIKQIKWLLNGDCTTVTGANFKFDQVWLGTVWGIGAANFNFDTYLAGSLLDENSPNSLEAHAKIYTDFGGYDKHLNDAYDKSKMEVVPLEDLLPYAGGDTDACLQVAAKLKVNLIAKPRQLNFYQRVLHPASLAFAKLEARGMYVDKKVYDELRVSAVNEIEEIKAKALDLLPGRLLTKHRDNLSLTKAALLSDFLFTPLGLNLKSKFHTAKQKKGVDVASTAQKHLSQIADPRAKEFIDLVGQYSKVNKILTTYIDGFVEHLRDDGKFHPNYFLFSTVTGRTSATGPAVQTLPKRGKWAKELRKVYIAPPGYEILNVDYAQGELKIAACLANETNMIKAYKNNEDIHIHNGLSLDDLLHPNDKINYSRAVELKKSGDSRVGELRQVGKCLSGDTEVLTPGGWVEIKSLLVGDIVYQYHDDKVITPTPVLETFVYEDTELFRYWDRDTELHATKNHRQPLWNRYGKKLLRELQDYDWELDNCSVPHAGYLGNQPTLSKEQTQLLVAVQADGSYERGRIRLGFTKQRKIDRLATILNSLGLTYGVTKNKAGLTRFSLKKSDVEWLMALMPNKIFTQGIVGKVNHQVFLDELRYWDGAIKLNPGDSITYSSYVPANFEIVQQIAVLSGRKCTIFGRNTITIARRDKHMGRISWRKNGIEPLGKQTVYCIRVESGMFVTRLNGKVTVTHNSMSFGLIYGMGLNGFITYAKDSYGVNLSEENGTIIRDKFFEMYPRLSRWHSDYKTIARKHKAISSPLGRVRHLPNIDSRDRSVASKAERQATNSPVQSCLSDLSLMSMGILNKVYPDLYIFAMTHDSLSFYVPEGTAGEWAKKIKDVMENLPLKDWFGWEPQLQFTVDAEHGPDLCNLSGLDV